MPYNFHQILWSQTICDWVIVIQILVLTIGADPTFGFHDTCISVIVWLLLILNLPTFTIPVTSSNPRLSYTDPTPTLDFMVSGFQSLHDLCIPRMHPHANFSEINQLTAGLLWYKDWKFVGCLPYWICGSGFKFLTEQRPRKSHNAPAPAYQSTIGQSLAVLLATFYCHFFILADFQDLLIRAESTELQRIREAFRAIIGVPSPLLGLLRSFQNDNGSKANGIET